MDMPFPPSKTDAPERSPSEPICCTVCGDLRTTLLGVSIYNAVGRGATDCFNMNFTPVPNDGGRSRYPKSVVHARYKAGKGMRKFPPGRSVFTFYRCRNGHDLISVLTCTRGATESFWVQPVGASRMYGGVEMAKRFFDEFVTRVGEVRPLLWNDALRSGVPLQLRLRPRTDGKIEDGKPADVLQMVVYFNPSTPEVYQMLADEAVLRVLNDIFSDSADRLAEIKPVFNREGASWLRSVDEPATAG